MYGQADIDAAFEAVESGLNPDANPNVFTALPESPTHAGVERPAVAMPGGSVSSWWVGQMFGVGILLALLLYGINAASPYLSIVFPDQITAVHQAFPFLGRYQVTTQVSTTASRITWSNALPAGGSISTTPDGQTQFASAQYGFSVLVPADALFDVMVESATVSSVLIQSKGVASVHITIEDSRSQRYGADNVFLPINGTLVSSSTPFAIWDSTVGQHAAEIISAQSDKIYMPDGTYTIKIELSKFAAADAATYRAVLTTVVSSIRFF